MGKRKELPLNRMIEHPVRFTRNQQARLRHYQQQHDGKSFAAAVRDAINAGLATLDVPRADELEHVGFETSRSSSRAL